MTFDLDPWHLGWSQGSIQDSAECGFGGVRTAFGDVLVGGEEVVGWEGYAESIV